MLLKRFFVSSHLSVLIYAATSYFHSLSLHDALPISLALADLIVALDVYPARERAADPRVVGGPLPDRKSTRLNSSHANISYAVFCLKKKTTKCRALVSLNQVRKAIICFHPLK